LTLLLMAGFLIALVIERERLFLLDPLAKVTRDGVAQPDAKASINFLNDVLLRDATGGRQRVYLAQNWDDEVIAPVELTCLGVFACLTNADHADGSVIPAGSRGRREPFVGVTMTSRRVEFVDEEGALVQVMIR
jgi:hypothetical protein